MDTSEVWEDSFLTRRGRERPFVISMWSRLERVAPRVRKADRCNAVYVMRARDGGPVKVGVSEDPYARARVLGVEVLYAVKSDEAYDVKGAAHAVLSPYRVKGEWFDVTPEFAIQRVKSVL